MKKTKLIRFTLALALSLGLVATTQAEIAVIVNADSGVSKLSKNHVKRVFLGKMKKLPGGGSAQPLDLKEGSKLRNDFYKKVVRKNAVQLKSYWSTRIFSGKGTPPKEMGDSADVVSWVSKNKNAIGYVDAGSVNDKVKVVYTIK